MSGHSLSFHSVGGGLALLSRRDWLRTSMQGSIGLSVLQLLRRKLAGATAVSEGSPPAIRSCIFVFYYGGPSHLDTYDLKPNAPSTVRGEFQPIATTVPGLRVCEHLPHMSQVMHKCAVIRSMHHTNRLHDSASTETFTGRQGPQGDREEFAPIPQFFPSHGGVLSFFGAGREVITHAVLPTMFHNVITVPCQGAGFLGSAFDPFVVEGDGNNLVYRSPILGQPEQLTSGRIRQRRELLGQLDEAEVVAAPQLDEFYTRAYGLLDSQNLKQALDISREPPELRERYGLTAAQADPGDAAAALSPWRSLRGQNLLQARRLVEAGIPFVCVNDFRQQGQNWDSHADNFGQHRKYLLPQADRSLATLIEDLDERGLLETTLVVALGEFGRTPQINASAGRDHWPDCYSILLAGGGVRGGSILGASDAIGAYPDRDPVTPADLAATIYWRFGIDPQTEIHDTTGRPWRLSDGRAIETLF